MDCGQITRAIEPRDILVVVWTRWFGRWPHLIAQWGLGFIFAYAGVSKLIDPLRFQASVLGYQLIPFFIVKPIVLIMPWIEIGLGLSLIMGWKPRLTTAGLSILLVLFTVLVGYAISNGWIVDCGCFGTPHPADGWKVIQNLFMLGISLYFNRNPTRVMPYGEVKAWLQKGEK